MIKKFLFKFSSSDRIDFTFWLRHKEGLSIPNQCRPYIVKEPEYLSHKRKAKENANVIETLKTSDKTIKHGLKKQTSPEYAEFYLTYKKGDIFPYKPDCQWTYMDFHRKMNDILPIFITRYDKGVENRINEVLEKNKEKIYNELLKKWKEKGRLEKDFNFSSEFKKLFSYDWNKFIAIYQTKSPEK